MSRKPRVPLIDVTDDGWFATTEHCEKCHKLIRYTVPDHTTTDGRGIILMRCGCRRETTA